MKRFTHHSDSEKISDEFSSDLRQVLKKVRRRSTIRIITISLVTVLFITLAMFFTDKLLLNNAANAVDSYVNQEFSIGEPNVYQGGYQFTEGIFGGVVQVQTYKVISGVPIAWDTQNYQFSIFSGISPYYGDYSPSPQIPTSQGVRMYDPQTEQRVMQFYYPSKHYTRLFHDIGLLTHIPPADEVEMALSFNHDYTYSQVNKMLPKGVTPAWYWVNTYSTRELQNNTFPLQTYEVYGFQKVSSVNSPSYTQTPTNFVNAIKSGLNNGPLQTIDRKIYNVLSHGTGRIVPANVKIIGVVVTGTPHQLMALQGHPYVRASSLGAIANPY